MSGVRAASGLVTEATSGVIDALSLSSDQKLAKVVALVDAMNERGGADELIAPLRPRLARLRPARPVRVRRLLYMPLDPMIVDDSQWSGMALSVRRGVLPLLTVHVERQLGERLERLNQALTQVQTGDRWSLCAMGQMIWPEGAQALLSMPAPGEAEGGADVAVQARLVGRLLQAGASLLAMAEQARLGQLPGQSEMKRVFSAIAPLGAGEAQAALGKAQAMIVVLAARLLLGCAVLVPAAEAVLGEATPMISMALEELTRHVEADLAQDAPEPAAQVTRARRAGELLNMVERSAQAARSPLRERLAGLRLRMAEQCASCFDAVLQRGLLAPARLVTPPLDMAKAATLEEAARLMRRLAHAASPDDPEERYAALLHAAAGELAGLGNLPLGDRARLVEILAGADAALELVYMNAAEA